MGVQVGRAARGQNRGLEQPSGPRTEGHSLFQAAIPRIKATPALQPAWALGCFGDGGLGGGMGRKPSFPDFPLSPRSVRVY